jgi:hypothetical protein
VPDAVPAVLGATLWDQVLDVLRDKMNAQTFNTWLRPTVQKSIDHARGIVTVEVPSAHFADWIADRDDVRQALNQVCGRLFAVQFAGREMQRPPAPRPLLGHVLATRAASDITAAYKNHPITFRVAPGLIAPKHRRAMKGAIWVFLWCIDKQTDSDGLVFGGRPVTREEIARGLGLSSRQTARFLDALVLRKYVTAKRVNEGLILRVNYQKKYPKGPTSAGSM